jgi:hypothetical protein
MPNILDTLSPEDLQQLLGAENIPERQRILQEQLGQAQLLANRPQRAHTTGAGAALSGVGDVIGAIGGGLETARVRGQQNGLLEQLVKAKMLGARAGGPGAAPGPGLPPPPPMDPASGVPQDPFARGPQGFFGLGGN